MMLYRTILMATDFSQCSEDAFQEAVSLAKDAGAVLRVLHVYQPPTTAVVPFATVEMYEELDREAREDAGRTLDLWTRRATDRGVRATPVLRRGIADVEIVDAAIRERADLVVLGTHGRRGASRLLLGSVASRVIAEAPCPVLTIRARRAAQALAS
jgi:nucleotide-binding universal stress UspA family protein